MGFGFAPLFIQLGLMPNLMNRFVLFNPNEVLFAI